MFARYADVAKAVSAGESGMFHQPSCRNLLALFQRGIAGQGQSLGGGSFPQLFMLLLGEHRALEKRSRAPGTRIALDNQHALSRANAPHRCTSLSQSGRSTAAFEVPFQIGIRDAGFAAGRECEGDAKNNEPSAFGSIKNAGAVGEAAGLAA